MSTLFELPNVLVNDILLTWLTILSVCRLDSASCSAGTRRSFLSTVTSSGFVVRDDCLSGCIHNQPVDDFAVWMMKRCVAARKLKIHR
jgi:hypothetical protein